MQSLPVEIEKLLLRPDISNHFAHILSSNLTPLIERNIKEAVNKTFLPVYSQQSSVMHQEVLRELHAEIHSVKAELTSWQSDAFRSQEVPIFLAIVLYEKAYLFILTVIHSGSGT